MQIFNILKLITLILTCLSISCKSSYEQDLCRFTAQIVNRDQFYRVKYKNYLSPEFYFIDSISLIFGGKNLVDYRNMPEEKQNYIYNKADSLSKIFRANNSMTIDSFWKLQKKLDRENTENLLSLISKINVQRLDTLKRKCLSESLLIFVHSNLSDSIEIIKAIDKIKLIDWNHARYNHIKRHFHER